jgi:hypothetical protein
VVPSGNLSPPMIMLRRHPWWRMVYIIIRDHNTTDATSLLYKSGLAVF